MGMIYATGRTARKVSMTATMKMRTLTMTLTACLTAVTAASSKRHKVV